MFKDEAAGRLLRSLWDYVLSCIVIKWMKEEKTRSVKGIKKQVVTTSIKHEDYKTCLRTGKEQLRKQNILRGYEHEVYTEEVNKVALSALDDKRHILGDGVHTLAWGHYKIKDH